MRLLQCKLRYQLAGCSILGESKYRYSVQAGTLRFEVQERFKAATGLTAGGTLAAAAKLGLTAGSANIDAKTTLGGTADINESDETATKIKPEIAIVEHCPFGWTIGHGSLGDPLQATSNHCLNGSYFLQKVQGYDHTCKVQFERSVHAAQLTFQLSVRDAFYVERIKSGLPKQSDGNERSRVIEEMRQKIAGLMVEKRFKSTGAPVDDNDELVLARIVATAHRSDSLPTPIEHPSTDNASHKRKVRDPELRTTGSQH